VPAPTPKRISDFKPLFTNLAQTSHYQVIFGGLPGLLRSHLARRGVNLQFIGETVGLLCSSTSLPGSSLGTADIVGNYMGVAEKIAHTRLFTQIELEFYIDKEYKTLKFLEHWIEFIANGSEQSPLREGYYFRMRYPDEYKTNYTKIIKFDRDYKNSIEYTFIGMFPIALNSIPVNYGTSEILKASATFNFDRYVTGRSDSFSEYNGISNNIDFKFPNINFSSDGLSASKFVPAKHGSGVGYRRIEDRLNPNSPIYYDSEFTRRVPGT